MRSDIFLAITKNSIPVAIPLTPLIAHYAILEFAKSPSRLPFLRASRRHLAARPVALFVALSPLISSRRPLSRPSLLIALPSLSAPFPSPSLSPLPSRRVLSLSAPFPSPSLSPLPSRCVLSLCSLPVALSLAPPFPSRSLSPLPSRRPLSRPSLPIALSLSAPFPLPSLSPLPSHRALSLRSALSLAPPFESRSLYAPFPSRSLSPLPSHCPLSFCSLHVLPSRSPRIALPATFDSPITAYPLSRRLSFLPSPSRFPPPSCFPSPSLFPSPSRLKSKAAH
ncbi:unnamed protein product [Closterium sp. NIES-64]|nr:unnamed protein product [Closterium sp. NIES-64]